MKKALMFPGQGSQFKGMGKNLFSKYKVETDLASNVLGYDLEELCVKDPNRQLVKTQFTQPALYVVNSFLYKEAQATPDFLIGHSLGEYNALLAAGAFDFETGLKLVQKRGALMAAASGGGMAAVLGLSIDELKEKLEQGNYSDVEIANFNTPTQIVLSGSKEGIAKVVKDFSDMKIRIIPLAVSAPFHSKFMKPAADQFATFLNDFKFNKLNIPVISNVTALPYKAEEVKELLSTQIASSVQWVDSIRYLMGQEVEEYQELGRAILTKMTKEIQENTTPIIIKEKAKKAPVAKITKSTVGSPKDLPSGFLGSKDFRNDYGVNYSYVAGGMYRGTASKELVIRMGKAGMLSFLGTGGMKLEDVSNDIDAIQKELNNDQPYGMNLLHHLADPAHEMHTVELYLEKGIKNVEAAAFMQMTEALVYFHVLGLSENDNGEVISNHRIMAKISRPEVAEVFMRPAPEKLLNKLLENDKITEAQAAIARRIPVSYDICVEADSGGHTDGGIAMVLLPSIQQLRNTIQKEYNYPKHIRIGLAGGIGTPQSAASAFIMGADFVLTGSINQCTVEAGTSDAVKDLLESINVQDTDYAPAGDMFEIGAKVQVLKKGVLFSARANKLYNLYTQYNALEDIPAKTIAQLEKNYFKKSIEEVWQETKTYLNKTGKVAELKRAESSPKYKMALVFRWYFGFSSRIAFNGDLENKVNFQIHTGPSLGAFNQWVKGTELESWRNRHVDEIGEKLMAETAVLLQSTLSNIIQ